MHNESILCKLSGRVQMAGLKQVHLGYMKWVCVRVRVYTLIACAEVAACLLRFQYATRGLSRVYRFRKLEMFRI